MLIAESSVLNVAGIEALRIEIVEHSALGIEHSAF
jgi:hypothetical protein